MRRGWAGGLPPTLGGVDFLGVVACGSVEDASHPREAVPIRFTTTSAMPDVHDERLLSELVAGLVESEPADATYGLTFVADLDPLTTQLRTLSTTAMHEFLSRPLGGPGRWLFTAPDHGRWIVTRPWGMDTAFIGRSVIAFRKADPGTITDVVTTGVNRELVG